MNNISQTQIRSNLKKKWVISLEKPIRSLTELDSGIIAIYGKFDKPETLSFLKTDGEVLWTITSEKYYFINTGMHQYSPNKAFIRCAKKRGETTNYCAILNLDNGEIEYEYSAVAQKLVGGKIGVGINKEFKLFNTKTSKTGSSIPWDYPTYIADGVGIHQFPSQIVKIDYGDEIFEYPELGTNVGLLYDENYVCMTSSNGDNKLLTLINLKNRAEELSLCCSELKFKSVLPYIVSSVLVNDKYYILKGFYRKVGIKDFEAVTVFDKSGKLLRQFYCNDDSTYLFFMNEEFIFIESVEKIKTHYKLSVDKICLKTWKREKYIKDDFVIPYVMNNQLLLVKNKKILAFS